MLLPPLGIFDDYKRGYIACTLNFSRKIVDKGSGGVKLVMILFFFYITTIRGILMYLEKVVLFKMKICK